MRALQSQTDPMNVCRPMRDSMQSIARMMPTERKLEWRGLVHGAGQPKTMKEAA
jgi:hypothetical protein